MVKGHTSSMLKHKIEQIAKDLGFSYEGVRDKSGIGFIETQEPSISRPSTVTVECSVASDGTDPGTVLLIVTTDGSNQVEYRMNRKPSAGATSARYSRTAHMEPGGTYFLQNVNDPAGSNSIEVVQEVVR